MTDTWALTVIEGPNLNLIGRREPTVYGRTSPESVKQSLRDAFADTCALTFHQSNHEGELVDLIQSTLDSNPADGIVINPGAYTHTSIAMRDALLAVEKPFVEVHLSNVHRREAFRQKSYFSDIAIGVIVGFGTFGYHLAVEAMLQHLEKEAAGS